MPRPRWTLSSLIVVVVLISLTAALVVPRIRPMIIESNERAAVASLLSIAAAESQFHGSDRDRNGVNDYWTSDLAGLHCLVDVKSGAPLGLIEAELTEADVFRLDDAGGALKTTEISYPPSILGRRGASDGYWFQSMLEGYLGYDLAEDTDGTGNRVHNVERFGFVAVPERWNVTGRHYFAVGEDGYVFRRDFGEAEEVNAGRRITEFPSGYSASWHGLIDGGIRSHWGKMCER